MKTIRLFTLLEHLRCRVHPVSAEVLAQALDVSVRTVYRDMATLQAIGAPVRGESGLGYLLEKDYFLPPLNFDPDELDAIMLGMRLIGARGDDVLSAAAARVSAKIGSVIDVKKIDIYKRLPLRAVSRPTEESEKAMRHLAFLRQAMRKKLQLNINYVDLQGRESDRIVRPLGLTVFDSVWLLTVWCEKRSDFRNLRVDNITSVVGTGLSFRPENGKLFEDYLKTL
ncbi:helix-turn-helix transcriptional regulator [Serratia plymuthica]|uniref:YafY family transcriptional regulator n=2 Tax=Serratia plymuthica TaxID=82996 RepID=A0A7T2SUF2_SERPL|nr:YafY family protein [Serratia plymuthica]QPS21803.1 YafY family transcriptional regulator [Serratia plymuthica]QPS63414.1 YafY family transcriptional regulator [Serratia plymuthica]RKS64228.1 putative DNA-binding transcriptional regulator YafY [Serratia plymuthica]